jgi:hypothetical protein
MQALKIFQRATTIETVIKGALHKHNILLFVQVGSYEQW